MWIDSDFDNTAYEFPKLNYGHLFNRTSRILRFIFLLMILLVCWLKKLKNILYLKSVIIQNIRLDKIRCFICIEC